jgi:proline dehydrogenase
MRLIDRGVSLVLPVVPRPIVRHFSKRYIAGDSVADALGVVRELKQVGALATLDILGEFTATTEQAQAQTQAYDALLQEISQQQLPETHVSVKLTALGLLLDKQLCLDHMRTLMRRVAKLDNFLRIDMEDSPCTGDTLDIYRTLREEYGERIGVVFQARLRRTLDDVDRLTDQPANFRLCKGIYLEPRTIAYTDAEIIRRNFVLILDQMFRKGAYVGIATHDELLVWEALRLIRRHGLDRSQYEFQMLLGVDEELRNVLIAAGHRLRVYVPFGEQWYAYSVRRLRENPQIAGHALRAILGVR